MCDTLYLDFQMEKCLAQPEDSILRDREEQLNQALRLLISDVRNKIGRDATFLELCKNVTYYLHDCLAHNSISEKINFAICTIDSSTKEGPLTAIKELTENPQIWDLAFEIYNGYLGRIAQDSMLMQFSLQKKHPHDSALQKIKEYQKTIEQLEIPRPCRL